jgi:hypothetical protein
MNLTRGPNAFARIMVAAEGGSGAQRSFSKAGVRAGGDSDEGETCGPEPRRAAGLDAGRNPLPLA